MTTTRIAFQGARKHVLHGHAAGALAALITGSPVLVWAGAGALIAMALGAAVAVATTRVRYSPV